MVQRKIILLEVTTLTKQSWYSIVNSNLDFQSAIRIADSWCVTALEELAIAHHLSTICNGDRIYVLDNTRIVEEGNFLD
jgi:ABC-type multidrug transport system fused ATPase/permease subunit